MTGRPRAVIVAAIVLILLGDLNALGRIPRHAQLHADGVLANEIGPLQAFVEQHRGLQFHHQVDIELVPADGVVPPRPPGSRKNDPQARDQAAVLVALGYADHVDDVLRADDALATQVLGRYDPAEKKLLVRNGPIDDFTRSILVHELTHALDDQHFGLGRGNGGFGNDESGLSFHALGEGDAVSIEDAYVAAHPAAGTGRQAAEQAASPDVPPAMLANAAFPYVVGARFVAALRGRDGTAGVDRAFDRPPVTSEQVLHPDRYFDRDGAREVERPRPEGAVVDRGVLGELGLYLLLVPVLGRDDARAATAGWGGDRYVAWTSGNDVCVEVHVVMDTTQDLHELDGGVQRWVATHSGAVTRSLPGGMLSLRRCIPNR